ncbi:reverse transcriptase domain-containing protein [Tanacetum coccineum]
MFNSSTGLFFFHFSSMDGLGSMHENGPWLIHNNSFILKKWNPDVKLLKEDFVNVPVWVKLHGVHVTAFSDDGLNVIATKLGTLLMLDSYTSDMCMRSWGRSSYARALIERRADVELKDTIVDECLKNIVSNVVKNLKNHSQSPKGVPVGPKVGFKPAKQVYRVVSKNDNANTIGNKKKDEEVRKEVTGEVDNRELEMAINVCSASRLETFRFDRANGECYSFRQFLILFYVARETCNSFRSNRVGRIVSFSVVLYRIQTYRSLSLLRSLFKLRRHVACPVCASKAGSANRKDLLILENHDYSNVNIDRSAGGMAYALQIPSDLCDEPHDFKIY